MFKNIGEREAGAIIAVIMSFIISVVFFLLEYKLFSITLASVGLVQYWVSMIVGAIEDNTKAVKELNTMNKVSGVFTSTKGSKETI